MRRRQKGFTLVEMLVAVGIAGAVVGTLAQEITVDHSMIYYPASLQGRPDLPGAGMRPITYNYQ